MRRDGLWAAAGAGALLCGALLAPGGGGRGLAEEPLVQLPPLRVPAQPPAPAPAEAGPAPQPLQATLAPPIFADSDRLPIDLPTALRLANASNPTVVIARLRVEQAYQRQRQAEVVWLPSLIAGVAYTRHDGLTQNQAGEVFNSNRWSFAVGGGAQVR